MSKAFEEINAGLNKALQHAKGKKTKVIVHKPETINVQAIRKKTGMSQQRKDLYHRNPTHAHSG